MKDGNNILTEQAGTSPGYMLVGIIKMSLTVTKRRLDSLCQFLGKTFDFWLLTFAAENWTLAYWLADEY